MRAAAPRGGAPSVQEAGAGTTPTVPVARRGGRRSRAAKRALPLPSRPVTSPPLRRTHRPPRPPPRRLRSDTAASRPCSLGATSGLSIAMDSGSTGRDQLLIRRQLSASNHSSVCSVPVFVLALLWLVAGGCCSDHGCSLLPPADTRHRAASLSAAVASPPARLLAATPPAPSRRCAGATPPPPRPPPINTPHTPFSPHHPVPIHGAAH